METVRPRSSFVRPRISRPDVTLVMLTARRCSFSRFTLELHEATAVPNRARELHDVSKALMPTVCPNSRQFCGKSLRAS